MSQTKITRRTFAKAGATAAAFTLTAAQTQRVLGANERIRVGFIGVANRGRQVLNAFMDHADMEVAALCDVAQSTLEATAQRAGGKADLYGDFRKVLDRKDIDAVVIATPDHWHAIQTIWACHAGKDVYVEKPLSITIHEGSKMVEAARRTKRVVQVGIHRRSSKLYAQAADLVRANKLGKVTVSRCYHLSNMYPGGIGKAPPSEPPKDLNWDLWLGPRPSRPFQATIAPYKFRWWDPFSSQVANNGVHFIDLIRWMTGDEAPASVCAMGGRFAVDDDRTIPDTMQVTFQCPSGHLLLFGQYEANGNAALPQPGYCELRGTQGTAYLKDDLINIIPERGGQFQDRKPRMEPMQLTASGGSLKTTGNKNLSLTSQHARNFLDCIKSRDLPVGDVEIGHRSTSFSLLANISLATGIRLEWDAKQERITNNQEANQLLHYEYRSPWTLEP
jgi:predicted dehydrogenase